jgi:hypothetical protein
MYATFSVSADALDRLRAHARTARGAMEVGGRLLLEGDRFVHFEAIENIAQRTRLYEPRDPIPGTPWLMCHTHPGRRLVGLSRGDRRWMRHHFRPLVVYAPSLDLLTCYWLDTRRPTGVKGYQVRFEARPRSRARPLRRPGAR